ncbi:MAG: PqqD family protein [Acidobacteria bacterium]|nr:PqqD family protein [Acidobacteriota bacterium]
MADLTGRFRQTKRAAGKALDDEYLVLDLGSGDYFGLGEAGGVIWEHLDGTRTLAEVADEIAERYGIDRGRARSDLLAFVDELLERDLVEQVDEEVG